MPGYPDRQTVQTLRWHPRITPFRLIFVLSTAVLGVTKAILVSRGDTVGSTTVEWISGVVLAISFQFLGNFEAMDHNTALTRFAFSKDCLAPLWRVITRPYADDEHHHTRTRGGDAVIVTPYRILVSCVTVALGVAKMACMYAGLSGAMNTLDWAFAVPVTLILYVIGLYENNTVGFAREFFTADYSRTLIETVIAVEVGLTIGLLLPSMGSTSWIYLYLAAIWAWIVFGQNNEEDPANVSDSSSGVYRKLDGLDDEDISYHSESTTQADLELEVFNDEDAAEDMEEDMYYGDSPTEVDPQPLPDGFDYNEVENTTDMLVH